MALDSSMKARQVHGGHLGLIIQHVLQLLRRQLATRVSAESPLHTLESPLRQRERYTLIPLFT